MFRLKSCFRSDFFGILLNVLNLGRVDSGSVFNFWSVILPIETSNPGQVEQQKQDVGIFRTLGRARTFFGGAGIPRRPRWIRRQRRFSSHGVAQRLRLVQASRRRRLQIPVTSTTVKKTCRLVVLRTSHNTQSEYSP